MVLFCRVWTSLLPQLTVNCFFLDGQTYYLKTPPGQLFQEYLSERATHAEDIGGKWLGKRLHQGSETESQVEQNPQRFTDFFVRQKHRFFQKYLSICKMNSRGRFQRKKRWRSRQRWSTRRCPARSIGRLDIVNWGRAVFTFTRWEKSHILTQANAMSRRLVMPWRSRSLQTTASFHLLRLSLSRLRSQLLELTAMFKGVEYTGCFF